MPDRSRAPRPRRPAAAETAIIGAAEGRHIGRPAPRGKCGKVRGQSMPGPRPSRKRRQGLSTSFPCCPRLGEIRAALNFDGRETQLLYRTAVPKTGPPNLPYRLHAKHPKLAPSNQRKSIETHPGKDTQPNVKRFFSGSGVRLSSAVPDRRSVRFRSFCRRRSGTGPRRF